MKKKPMIISIVTAALALVILVTTAGLAQVSAAPGVNAQVNEGIQEITTQLEASNYPALVVQKGVLVKWTIVATSQTLNSCNNEIVIPSLGITKSLKVGDNVIEFTPAETGIIQYSCWMGMINSTIAVVNDINDYSAADVEAQIGALPQGRGGFCGGSSLNGANNGAQRSGSYCGGSSVSGINNGSQRSGGHCGGRR